MREQSGYRKLATLQVTRYTFNCENATRLVSNGQEKALLGEQRQPVCSALRRRAALVRNS